MSRATRFKNVYKDGARHPAECCVCGEIDSLGHLLERMGVGGTPSDLRPFIQFFRRVSFGAIGRSPALRAPILPPVACEIDWAWEVSSEYVFGFRGQFL